MPALIPFAPRGGFTETLEWSTEVLQTKGVEQRIARRGIPRKVLTFGYLLTNEQYQTLSAIIRNHDDYYVPDWSERLQVSGISSGSSIVVSVDTSATNLVSGDKVVVWGSDSTSEIATTTSVGASSITLDSLSNSYTSARIMPALTCRISTAATGNRPANNLLDVSVTFTTFAYKDIAATTYTQYQSHDVISDLPVVGDGSLSVDVSWDYSELDNLSGLVSVIRQRDVMNNRFEMRWMLNNQSETNTLRKWICSRRGKQKVFWLSTKTQDIVPNADISASTIYADDYQSVSLLGRTENFDLEIESVSGTVTRCRTTNVSAGAPGTVIITVDQALSLSLANIKRISFLHCVRFDSDRVEFEHTPPNIARVTMPCIEVLEP